MRTPTHPAAGTAPFGLRLDNSYARELPGASVACRPAAVPAPRLLFLNHALAGELGLDAAALAGPEGAAVFAGNAVPAGAEPVAQAYAGHQFGGFSPQLGDGRALLLGEVVDRAGQRRDIAFKGSGRTPFSRSGDGKAAVGPMLREVLLGEAMHALGVPTTRALAVAATGEWVLRDTALPGAVLTRVAASHLRVGTFQYFAARGERATLQRLVAYALARHPPGPGDESDAGSDGTPPWLALLRAVARRQARLVAQWMNLGFIHGVMNTDNMTVSGETIDYGPCAFVEAYDPAAVFSSIDRGGRYAFGNQPGIARWNLARLAEALLPLALPEDADPGPDGDAGASPQVQAAVEQASGVIDAFPGWYDAALRAGQRRKLGLAGARPGDDALADAFLALLQRERVDHTLAWRRLADAAAGDANPLRALFPEPAAVQPWLVQWQQRLAQEDAAAPAGGTAQARSAAMRAASPWVIPRNHRVEEALAAASAEGDLGPFERLLAALRRPFDEDAAQAPYAQPAPPEVTAGYRTFCGT